MGIQGLCPVKNTSYSNLRDKKYPYLLKGVNISYPNQVWGDRYYLYSDEERVYVSGRGNGLVFKIYFKLGTFQ
jgi:hypothetical protein